MEKQILLILVIFLWLSIITFGGHKSSGEKNIQKSSTISDSAISTSNILYTNADGDLGIDPLVNYKLTPGLVMPFFSNTIPTGWVLCDGRQLSKTEYSALHAIIGNTFGESAGNFLLPDLRGKFIMGSGSSLNNYGDQENGWITFSLGDKGGEYTHQLTVDEMPRHDHPVNMKHNSPYPLNTGTNYIMTDKGLTGDKGTLTDTNLVDVRLTGGDAYHENRPPYFVANYIMFTGKN